LFCNSAYPVEERGFGELAAQGLELQELFQGLNGLRGVGVLIEDVGK